MTVPRLPIGISDFSKVRAGGYYFVDKSMFIKEIIDASAEVLLIPRPRRFGKTLNLSMLRYFFEKSEENSSLLFSGLKIFQDKAAWMHQGKYPVIYLTFKDMKETTWEAFFHRVKMILEDLFSQHEHVATSDALSRSERRFSESILMKKAETPDYAEALRYLSRFLSKYHQSPVVILIDEYDTPIHAAYTHQYFEKAIAFMRNFLSSGFKDNPHLFKGVLSGILRVARESVFSGLNNLGVYTILSGKFSDAFGFTEEEVADLMDTYGMRHRYEAAASWYNGYRFGDAVLYNPWSILNYVDEDGEFRPYWVNTADHQIIDRLATRGGKEIREEIGQLLDGNAIVRPIFESIVMRDLEVRDDLIWSFLLFNGYLKTVGGRIRKNRYKLAVPNEEVRTMYEFMVERWFAEKIESNRLEEMVSALKNGDATLFERTLRQVVEKVMSYHDLSGEPEKFYHALVLGMLVWMSGEYDIRSNRESGYGRYDVMLKPKDLNRPGIIIEFKKVDDNTSPERALEAAMEQIEAKHYAAELQAAGIKNILKLAIAFRGKDLWIKHG